MNEKRIVYKQHVLSVFRVSIELDSEQPQKTCDGEVAGVPMDSVQSPLEEPVEAELVKYKRKKVCE